MRTKTLLSYGVAVILGFFTLSSYAEDLITIYYQALENDPTFKQAHAEWLAEQELIPIARAGLLPTIDVTSAIKRSYADPGPTDDHKYFNSSGYTLAISQPVFNLENWRTFSTAKTTVKAAAANYAAAAQDLMYRTAAAYFDVLKAYDQLRYTLANKKAIYQELITTRKKYEVGLIAITGYYEAQSRYDSAIAQEIIDRTFLNDELENLRAITGHYYSNLKGLEKQAPLVTPQPENINQWVTIANEQNYTIKMQQFLTQAAKEFVGIQKAQGFPTVSADVAGGETFYKNFSDNKVTTASVGLSLNYPLYTGGLISSQTKQAHYLYLQQLAQLQYTYNNVTSLTRQSYLAVVSGISKIKADAQTIKSNRKQLESTQAAYQVGTRIMPDVLDALAALYQAQQQYADDQYDYIVSTILLKQYAGTLSDGDIAKINHWLDSTITFDAKVIKNLGRIKKTSTSSAVKSRAQSYQRHASHVTAAQKTAHKTSSIKQSQKITQIKTQHSTGAHHVSQGKYGIQVAALRSYTKTQQLIRRYSSLNLMVMKTTIRGQTWYKVIQTGFSSRASAKHAIQSLPIALKQDNPWVIRLT
jgi:outer membrane protein